MVKKKGCLIGYPFGFGKRVNWIGKNKVIVIYGARQVGKSTILSMLKEEFPELLILNAENPKVNEILKSMDIHQIKFLFGNHSLIAIDEAQKIHEIGSILKYIFDHKEINSQIIATGSSSFELANKVTEPLTGRNVKFIVHPLSLSEIYDTLGGLWITDNLENLITYGLYPEIVTSETLQKITLLENLNIDYLFQDVLQLDNMLNSQTILKLLKALAYQIGAQVSFSEIGQTVGLAPQTVQKYLDLLEKSFVIYSLPAYNRNLRNEIKKSRKYFFTDTGMRNAVINDFRPFSDRTDRGALWENFCINERLKFQQLQPQKAEMYFWRTYDQAEIDLIEVTNDQFNIFEFKTGKNRKKSFPDSFLQSYTVARKEIITPANVFRLWESS